MGFQLQHASKNAKLVPRPNEPPVVKDMVIKNGRFAKANAVAPTKRKTSTSTGDTTAIYIKICKAGPIVNISGRTPISSHCLAYCVRAPWCHNGAGKSEHS